MHLTAQEWGRVPVGAGGFSRGQANRLLAAARAHAMGGTEGTAILSDHHDHLTARQAVGVIAAQGCSLEILPKLDPLSPEETPGPVRARLVHMLDVALRLNLSTGEATSMAHRAETLLEVFIRLYADRLLAEVRHGLPRHYRQEEDDLRALRGRLDVRRQFTANAVRPDRLACRFDTLSPDTPLLRIMKACVLLLGHHVRSPDTRRKLAELRFLLADVTDVPIARLPWSAVRIDRTSRRWQALLELAGRLIGRRWQQTHVESADSAGITLLFPMNDLFEAYVAAQMRRAASPLGLEVVAQGGHRYCLGGWSAAVPCRGDAFRTTPDLIIRRRGLTLAIVDTKWKRLSPNPLDRKRGVSQTDVYQLMAYARVYNCNRLMLLYPAGPGQVAGILHSFGIAGGLERLDIGAVALSPDGEHTVSQLRSMLKCMAR
jgi:5-methylcytosine-specific restriction enzyme subunit McrC